MTLVDDSGLSLSTNPMKIKKSSNNPTLASSCCCRYSKVHLKVVKTNLREPCAVFDHSWRYEAVFSRVGLL